MQAEPTRDASKACANRTGLSPAVWSEDWSLDFAHLGGSRRDRTSSASTNSDSSMMSPGQSLSLPGHVAAPLCLCWVPYWSQRYG